MVQHIICVDISTFHFPSQQVLQKISLSVLLNFGNSSLHILEIKGSGTCQKWFSKGTNSYTL